MRFTPLSALLTLLLLFCADRCGAARILGLFATPAKSHSRVFEALFQELAVRGHQVTFGSPFGLQWPSNLNASSKGKIDYVHLDDQGVLGSIMGNVVGPKRKPLSESLWLWTIAPDLCRNELNSPGLKPIIEAGKNKTISFDLVIVESFFFDCFVPVARLFEAPLVLFTSQWAPQWAHQAMGNPDSWATSPNMFLPYTHKMSFFERMHNVMHSATALLARKYLELPRQDKVVKEIFGGDFPTLANMEKEAALMLINSHPITNSPHANLPNVVEVGGIHIKPAKSLDKDLQKFFDDSPKGVILFSLGSLITKDTMDPERLTTLTTAMGAIDYPILWRWDTEDVPNLPKNVKIVSWLPQRDVLAQKNLRLFVTHGGLLSTQEATYEGVPRLVMPFFGDQQSNAQKVVQLGVGLSLNYYSASAEELVKSVNKIMNDKSFSERAKQLSTAFRDQLNSPLERAVFWTEHVIKQKGAQYLRTTSIDLNWLQDTCLDVILALILSAAVVSIIATKLMKKFLNHFSRKVKSD
ncbi:UDP-glycosyltransferase UGT5-like [Neocloeon triangulifer]|uniref:UDP-glycosyltransferase UGT5-like n=1 Tax=Neocloeon triangulifer TaxID=2078957 RepID=UPI00286F0FA6|nr:UDP-glycosyltransferase UGT5-like [Neocloeon triangulifer]XP_059478834.1 UDP-glycosyltransferase UGT5-like [Neocloeon triangulifer]XP_059478835.1 UDP-glycosyltransferase UGT5-like [Neocloeon triangulifer]XP_059478836.1 UDP-glycosyltransferase UGT5-like [Neocloeon triangulifer]XP_059478837.1 UDP-glycosyltransferase UGT5-like [Neocloeon triangulifer]XP_059478839.1 UDP-glycosyltransferase UGT5-like [Neocloeon triangulifer]